MVMDHFNNNNHKSNNKTKDRIKIIELEKGKQIILNMLSNQ